MCTYSMIADHYKDMWQSKHWYPNYPEAVPMPSDGRTIIVQQSSPISREEFEELKRQVLEMKELLKRAIKYDEANGEPECEMAEKVAILKRVAEIVGVDLSEVVSAPKASGA